MTTTEIPTKVEVQARYKFLIDTAVALRKQWTNDITELEESSKLAYQIEQEAVKLLRRHARIIQAEV
jgi:hypothetical protein